MAEKLPLSRLPEYYSPALRKVLETLGKIVQDINIVEMLTPVNAKEEEKKWTELAKRGKWTNPLFRYDEKLLASVAKKEDALMSLRPHLLSAAQTMAADEVGKTLYELVCQRYREAQLSVSLAANVLKKQEAKSAAIIRDIYGTPETETVAAAYDYARQLADGTGKIQQDDTQKKRVRRELKDLEFRADEIREYFIWTAEQCGIARTRPVRIDEIATSIDVRDKSSKGSGVFIPESRKVSGLKLVELCGHEVLCHWQDSERAARVLPLLGSGTLKPADETLYEGHAALTDYHTHLMLGDKTQKQQLPFYILAIEMARNGLTFAEAAPILYEKIRIVKLGEMPAMRRAWKTCLRIFRGSNGGMNNDATSYAFTKDRAYFEGRMVADKLHAQHQDNILEISTISLKDVELLQPVVEFDSDTSDPATTENIQRRLIQKILGEEFVF